MATKQIDYHFIGVGGIGMSALAEILISRDFIVSGSDLVENEIVKKLQAKGLIFYLGQKGENISNNIKKVIFSGAINPSNAELVAARAANLPIETRSKLLGDLMAKKKGIAIAGTHGKTTTSTMISLIFEKEGLDPTIAIGGEVRNIGGNAKDGKGDYFIAEACEYKRYFLDLAPEVAVVTNIEADHLDYFKDLPEIESAFGRFIHNTRNGGTVVAGIDSTSVSKVVSETDRRLITFGINSNEADYRAINIKIDGHLQKFEIVYRGQSLGIFCLKIPGIHNIQNALAATAVALACDIKLITIKNVIADFTGADRRMQFKGKRGERLVFDDYAHHPSEIMASLAGIKSFYPTKKIWCVFQPHQYSRTKFLLKEFAQSFNNADVVIVPEIYAVRDTAEDIASVSGEDLVKKIKNEGKEAYFIAAFNDCARFLDERVADGDIIITMGAGPVNEIAELYLK